jgi:hypothetical protein
MNGYERGVHALTIVQGTVALAMENTIWKQMCLDLGDFDNADIHRFIAKTHKEMFKRYAARLYLYTGKRISDPNVKAEIAAQVAWQKGKMGL